MIDLASWYKESLAPKIEQIRKAMDEHHRISFVYYAPKGESRRSIEPYYLIFDGEIGMYGAIAGNGTITGLFKLNRMQNFLWSEYFLPQVVPIAGPSQ